MVWRFWSARGLRAGQSDDGVSREAGRTSCLLRKCRNGSHRLTKILDHGPASGSWSRRKWKRPEELNAEPRAKAGRDRGSLSISIVAIESGETHPKEPASSQGGYRDYGLITGNAPGAQNPDQCVSRNVMDSLGGEPVA
jgi:hypothetical protein